jgi:NAD(P)-dependent dehydrogenase (short-subunit alcohol dehydrogenase family)
VNAVAPGYMSTELTAEIRAKLLRAQTLSDLRRAMSEDR